MKYGEPEPTRKWPTAPQALCFLPFSLNVWTWSTKGQLQFAAVMPNFWKIKGVWNSFRIFFEQVWDFFLDFLAGTICLVFATVWNLNLSFCMVFATFGHVHLPFCMGFTTCGHVHLPFCMVFATFWHVHLPFCMGFPTCGHVHLPFCMVFATFWHVHLPFCMGCSTCEHVHPNIYRCGSLGLDKKRVGGIEGGR